MWLMMCVLYSVYLAIMCRVACCLLTHLLCVCGVFWNAARLTINPRHIYLMHSQLEVIQTAGDHHQCVVEFGVHMFMRYDAPRSLYVIGGEIKCVLWVNSFVSYLDLYQSMNSQIEFND